MTDIHIHTAIDIDVPASEAWRLLGDGFGDWAEWSPGIKSSTLQGPLAEGVIRINDTPSLGRVHQELVRFEPGSRALAYEMRSGLPPVFSRVRNDWVIAELAPGRCRVKGEAIFVMKGDNAAMRSKLEDKMRASLEAFTVALRDRLQQPA